LSNIESEHCQSSDYAGAQRKSTRHNEMWRIDISWPRPTCVRAVTRRHGAVANSSGNAQGRTEPHEGNSPAGILCYELLDKPPGSVILKASALGESKPTARRAGWCVRPGRTVRPRVESKERSSLVRGVRGLNFPERSTRQRRQHRLRDNPLAGNAGSRRREVSRPDRHESRACRPAAG
jgi:hypothetical protein